MKLPRIILYALMGTFAGLAIPATVYLKVHFSPEQNVQEKEVSGFVAAPLSLHTRGYITTNRTSPVSSAGSAPQAMPGQQSPAPASRKPSGPKADTDDRMPAISFILQGGGTPMAVIDGYVLKEGNSFEGWCVLRIEQKRVLLENRKVKKWILIN